MDAKPEALIKACENMLIGWLQGLPAPRAEVMVFRGDPMFNRRREIFYALSR